MARTPRQDAPGATHHVMLRGIERRRLFRCASDRDDFLARLEQVLDDGAGRCFAWALMDNHVHLVLRTGSSGISKPMSRLNTGYAAGFNRRYDRVGHLFQNRFRSILVTGDAYLLTLLRYVHLNPLHAGTVDTLEQLAHYAWSGHRSLMGGHRYAFHAVDEVLGWFAREPQTARAELMRLMRSSPSSADNHPSFANDSLPPQPRVAALRRAWTLVELLAWVCGEVDADVARVQREERGRSESEARAIFGAFAIRDLGFPVSEASRAAGVTRVPLARALCRGALVASERGLQLPARPPRRK